MPEGHTVHRLAGLVARDFAGRRLVADSPQGRFTEGAREIDGCRCTGTDAHGKHLLVALADPALAAAGAAAGEADRWLHVHLGLYGKWAFGQGDLPAVRGAVRLRLAAAADGQPLPDLTGPAGTSAGRPEGAGTGWAAGSDGGLDGGLDGDGEAPGDAPGEADTGRDADVLAAADATDDGTAGPAHGRADDGLERGGGAEVGQLDPGLVHWAELRGPTRCEVLDAAGVAALHARLGPDPLRADGDAAAFAERVRASRTSVAALLMRQEVVSGIGNIYRAEALYRARLSPATPGRDVDDAVLTGIWEDLAVLMRAGVRAGRIVTTAPADRGGQRGRQGAFYVYGRAGQPCRVCSTPVETQVLAGRNLFWCPSCQRPGQARTGAERTGTERARRSRSGPRRAANA